jgi:hypothetical protein
MSCVGPVSSATSMKGSMAPPLMGVSAQDVVILAICKTGRFPRVVLFDFNSDPPYEMHVHEVVSLLRYSLTLLLHTYPAWPDIEEKYRCCYGSLGASRPHARLRLRSQC